MSIDSSQERQTHSDDTKRGGQNTSASAPESAIVDPQGNPYSRTDNAYQKFKSLIKRVLEKIPHGERMMILLTAAVALATFAQAGIAWYSNHSAGKIQTDQFNQMKSVADRMEGAADSFAGNSANINQGIAAATITLQAQAKATQEAANTSAAQARLTRQSLEATSSAICQPITGFRSNFPYMDFSISCGDGRVDARLISGWFEASVVELNNSSIEALQTQKVVWTRKFLLTPKLVRYMRPDPFDIKGFSMSKFNSWQQMVQVRSHFVYDNGFGRAIPDDLCRAMLPERDIKGNYTSFIERRCGPEIEDVLRAHQKEEEDKKRK